MKTARHFYPQLGKRLFDAIVAAGLLIILSPVLTLIALAVRSLSGSPVLYRQKRVGKGGKLFDLLKFRSMSPEADGQGTVTVKGDARITPIGAILRNSKLDELPQLLNVLKGDMSLVGPRPEVEAYASSWTGPARAILTARPGLTSPASLLFRDEERLLEKAADPVGFNDRVLFPIKTRMNLSYLDQCSLGFDLKCLMLTAAALVPSRRQPRGRWV